MDRADRRRQVLAQGIERAQERGVQDIIFAVVDGLKGFPEAITATFPETIVQTCIVHLVRHSLSFVGYQDRKRIVPDLRPIYRAETAVIAEQRLAEFEASWARNIPPSPARPRSDV